MSETGSGPPRALTAGLVSVIMPAYQAEAYIEQALDSALAQDYQAVEVIVVDDGSTDRTGELARTRDATVIGRANGGAGAARNTGVAHARGEFIAFHDADDLWPADRLSTQVAHLLEHPRTGIVLGLTQTFLTPGQLPFAHGPRTDATGRLANHPSTMLARRELFDVVGGFDESLRMAQDIDWVGRAKDAGIRMGHVDQVVLRYRVHAANTTRDIDQGRMALLRSMRMSVQRKRRAGNVA